MTTPTNYITLNQLGTEILEEFPETKFAFIYFEENKIWKNNFGNYNIKPVYFKRVENDDNTIIFSHDKILKGNLVDINPIITIPKSLNKYLTPENDFILFIFVDLRKTKEYNGHKYYKYVIKKTKNDIAEQIREQIIGKKEDEDEDEDEDLDIDAMGNDIEPSQPKQEPEIEEVEEQPEPEQPKPEVKETKRGRKPRK